MEHNKLKHFEFLKIYSCFSLFLEVQRHDHMGIKRAEIEIEIEIVSHIKDGEVE